MDRSTFLVGSIGDNSVFRDFACIRALVSFAKKVSSCALFGIVVSVSVAVWVVLVLGGVI
jgi:hypothetical protein